MMRVYLTLAQETSDSKDKADIMIKYGQLEAQVLSDQRALEIFNGMSLTDPELYREVMQ